MISKKGQIGTTITWAVGLIAIGIILLFFILVTLSIFKKEVTLDILSKSDKSLFNARDYQYSLFTSSFLRYRVGEKTMYQMIVDYNYKTSLERDELKDLIKDFFDDYGYSDMGYGIEINEKKLVNLFNKNAGGGDFFFLNSWKGKIYPKNQVNEIKINLYLEELG